ncbi:hypothetical protein ACA910_020761 [Epithemia clementina (nom. ined.)]
MTTTTATNGDNNQPTNGNGNHANHADNASFRRQYAAALAQALRASEASEPSLEELCHETYLQLCSDDPLVSARGCRALANALLLDNKQHHKTTTTTTTNPNSTKRYYAPSDRLVEGIQHICQRINTNIGKHPPQPQHSANHTEKDSSSHNNKEDDSKDGNEEQQQQEQHESLVQPLDNEDDTASSLSSPSCAYSILAWVVFGRIPLLCCLSDDLSEASAWIGSYRGPATFASTTTTTTRTVSAHQQQQQPGESTENDKVTTTATNEQDGKNKDDQDSFAEVWAAESDPSDYGFESDSNPQQQLQELDAWANDMLLVHNNPHHLSSSSSSSPQPGSGSTTHWKDLAQAVTNLLRQLTYSKLAALTMTEIRQWRITEYLTQLIITLLLLPTTSSSSSSSSVSPLFRLDESSSSSSSMMGTVAQQQQQQQQQHWQTLALQPLHVFRDLVTVHTNALLEEYLSLLQNLLQVDHQLNPNNPNVGANTRTLLSSTLVAPATWIGLTSLSNLCSNHCEWMNSKSEQQQQYLSKLRTCILQMADDLCTILEKSESLQDEDAKKAIPWTFLPIFQVLVTQSVNGRSPHNPLSNAQAQILLNSGLFRWWLLWWERQPPTTSKPHDNNNNGIDTTPTPIRTAMEYNVFRLSLIAPTLLGKYAWRFPGYAAAVTTPTTTTTKGNANRSLRLLWNLVGIKLSEQQQASGASSIQWKNTSSKGTTKTLQQPNPPPPTTLQCQQNAWLEYSSLCHEVGTIISRWTETRRHDKAFTNDDEEGDVVVENSAAASVLEGEVLLLEQFDDFAYNLAESSSSSSSSSSIDLLALFCYHMPPPLLQTNSGGGGGGGGSSAAVDDKKPSEVVRQSMAVIQKALHNWEPTPNEVLAKMKLEDDDEEDKRQTNTTSTTTTSQEATTLSGRGGTTSRSQRQQRRLQDSAVATIRKSCKLVHSAIDSCTLLAKASHHGIYSSKAD